MTKCNINEQREKMHNSSVKQKPFSQTDETCWKGSWNRQNHSDWPKSRLEIRKKKFVKCQKNRKF